jgi:hypothetical protein
MQRTVTVEGTDYLLQPMTAGDALDIQEEFTAKAPETRTASSWSFRIVAATLRKSVEETRNIPWPHYQELVTPALELNGFKTKADDAPGELQAGASPAA